MKNTRLVLVEFSKNDPYVCKFVSNKRITNEEVLEFLIVNDDFNEETDSVTFLDDIVEIDLDQQIVEE